MLKALRLFAVVLFLIATFAMASTTDNSGYLGEGGSPDPSTRCAPGSWCNP